VAAKKAEDRQKWQEGERLKGPRAGNTVDEKFGHYPLYTAATNRAWYGMTFAALREEIPRYVALDDTMVYVVVKVFKSKERAEFFGVDFDQQGNIWGARQGVGTPPSVTFGANRYYLVFRKYYVLCGAHKLGSQKKLLSQRDGKAKKNVEESEFSFGAVLIPQKYQAEENILNIIRYSKNWADSNTRTDDDGTPPATSKDPIWVQESIESTKDFFWEGKSVSTQLPKSPTTPTKSGKSAHNARKSQFNDLDDKSLSSLERMYEVQNREREARKSTEESEPESSPSPSPETPVRSKPTRGAIKRKAARRGRDRSEEPVPKQLKRQKKSAALSEQFMVSDDESETQKPAPRPSRQTEKEGKRPVSAHTAPYPAGSMSTAVDAETLDFEVEPDRRPATKSMTSGHKPMTPEDIIKGHIKQRIQIAQRKSSVLRQENRNRRVMRDTIERQVREMLVIKNQLNEKIRRAVADDPWISEGQYMTNTAIRLESVGELDYSSVIREALEEDGDQSVWTDSERVQGNEGNMGTMPKPRKTVSTMRQELSARQTTPATMQGEPASKPGIQLGGFDPSQLPQSATKSSRATPQKKQESTPSPQKPSKLTSSSARTKMLTDILTDKWLKDVEKLSPASVVSTISPMRQPRHQQPTAPAVSAISPIRQPRHQQSATPEVPAPPHQLPTEQKSAPGSSETSKMIDSVPTPSVFSPKKQLTNTEQSVFAQPSFLGTSTPALVPPAPPGYRYNAFINEYELIVGPSSNADPATPSRPSRH